MDPIYTESFTGIFQQFVGVIGFFAVIFVICLILHGIIKYTNK